MKRTLTLAPPNAVPMRWTSLTTEPLAPDAAERVRAAFIANVRAGMSYDGAAKAALAPVHYHEAAS